MKKAKFGFLVLAVAISLPIAGYITNKFYTEKISNTFLLEYECEKDIVPELFYQVTQQAPYTKENVVTSFKEDKEKKLIHAKFILPPGRYHVVRLDFGSRPGKIKIRNLSFRSWKLTPEILKTSNFQNIHGVKFNWDYLMSFHSNHQDPHIVFPTWICKETPFNAKLYFFFLGASFLLVYLILLLLGWLTFPRQKASPEV